MASPFSRFRHAANRGSMVAIAALLALAGCASPNDGETQTYFPEKDQTGSYNPAPTTARQGVFGGDGLAIFGGGQKKKSEEGGSGGIGVNSFLWRASLDTIAFMPLASADPFGGVIITDWYQDPNALGERFKVTVYILDRRLRADGVKVAVFRQEKNASGDWVDAKVNENTALQMENAILVRARQLRINTIEAGEQK